MRKSIEPDAIDIPAAPLVESDGHDALASEIAEICLLDGDFTLSSGIRTKTYFDKYRFEAQPVLLRVVAKRLAAMLPPDTERLAGLELGGIPLVTALSLETNIPAVFVRKEKKNYGTRNVIEGSNVQGKRTMLIEDVVTTGAQIRKSAKDLMDARANVIGVMCVFWRNSLEVPDMLPFTSIPFKALFTATDIT
jgi:orotate phosphoribosyltransferase